jgi:Putative beta barrel porin-7 (BBP7)
MRLHKYQILAALGLLLAGLATKARAQINLPFGPENYQEDFQLFAPVEIDLDNEPAVDDHGYSFNYSKLFWSFSGERVQIGDPNVVVYAEQIYRQNSNDEGTLPPPYQVYNGLQSVIPDAGFGMGDRYEIGYHDRGNGWMIGILDGPLQQQNMGYGMSPTLDGTALPNTPPPDPDYHSPPSPVSQFQLYGFGFGSVHINFETPPGYLLGFRDYINFLAGASIGTQAGPTVYVGNYGGEQEPGLNNQQNVTYTFFRLADDIDEDGIFGSIIIVDPVTGLLTTMTDFDDLHEFNIAFDHVDVRTRTKMDGIEAMWTHELTNRHYMAKHQNNFIELGLGARFLTVKDYFSVVGGGGIMGGMFTNTWLDNDIVGPQLRAKWINQRERWRLSTTTSVVLGYNAQNWRQENGIGTQFIPGALNRPLYAQPTYSQHGLVKEDFSTVGELRLEAAYFVTQAIALKAGYTGMYVGNVRRASTSVKYALPDMGFRDSGTQNLISNGFDLGIDFVY